MDMADLIIANAPILIPLLGSVALIIFTKNYLFRDLISKEMFTTMIVREKEQLAVQSAVSGNLKDISTQLVSLVSEIKNLIAANWDNRRYIDDKMDHFDDRLDHIETKLDRLETIIPKRKEDV